MTLLLKIIRPGWHRLKRGCYAHHPTEWQVKHCGHATALHPFFALSPDGKQVAASRARAFDSVEEAKLVVEGIIEGRLALVRHPDRAGWWIPEVCGA